MDLLQLTCYTDIICRHHDYYNKNTVHIVIFSINERISILAQMSLLSAVDPSVKIVV